MTLNARPNASSLKNRQPRNGVRRASANLSSGEFSGCKTETLTYRAAFARKWSQFIQENFDGPQQVAKAFHVDSSTAENWWAGRNAPQGWVIGRAACMPRLRWPVVQMMMEDEQ
ncbi:MAG: hypothetical protein AAGK66_07305 [Pseudomonadota bacterium]